MQLLVQVSFFQKLHKSLSGKIEGREVIVIALNIRHSEITKSLC